MPPLIYCMDQGLHVHVLPEDTCNQVIPHSLMVPEGSQKTV